MGLSLNVEFALQARGDEWPYCTDESAGGQQGEAAGAGDLRYGRKAHTGGREAVRRDRLWYGNDLFRHSLNGNCIRNGTSANIMLKYGYRGTAQVAMWKLPFTRMHSSRMRTARFSGHLYRGWYLPGGVCPGGVCPGGVQEGVCPGRSPGRVYIPWT